ncbi:hypothetical protein TWF225_004449 [Orbilia oligospora]|nr:hypothetical protein TWF225_004449 [Orbilia oligospora]KAF3243473.1 hypothetical protein TWF128_010197 [Orbilia oligospora]KAF3243474.1 hypothetical protein TWF128_010197 [Orbilia oligospora]KAF3250220.1 hypothetical protein TWF217_008687 [Orbilia oligospora]KAF3288868.1 hypothetical protein TWF132_007907 [Orbilia oligospora]
MAERVQSERQSSHPTSFTGNHPHLEKIHQKLHHAKVELVHFKHSIGKLGNIVNPNHRHDEEHEQEVDRKRSEIAESHRFESFAPIREGHLAKFYIDGRDYFWALATALESAKEVIYIADWWLSPELFLRRPPAYSENDRVDTILKRRAEAGVKIYIIVYKEVEAALTCNSQHTKHALHELCPKGSPGHGNIRVMRHPDHNVFDRGGDMTFYWAHHEKYCVIDHELAFIGGLDICFGRWDLKQHPLADVHPETVRNEIWPGQDYNNNRIMDFQNVEDWKQNQLSKTEYGRMPWHDVALAIRGRSVLDIAQHFVETWNHAKRDKYKRDGRYDWLQLEWAEDDILGVQHPRFPVGDYIKHPLHPLNKEKMEKLGKVTTQLVRSSADWSHGILTEHSIQNAYQEVIRNAKHYVYIENQFFITATGEKQKPIINTIGAAIVDAITTAHSENRKFRVIVIIPLVPGFAGDLRDKGANGTRAIMDYQYKSMFRGEHSICGILKGKGIDPVKYISFFSLRSYDRLNRTERIEKKEERTGVKYEDVQHAQAHEVMSEEGVTGGHGYGKDESVQYHMQKDREAFEKDQKEDKPHDKETKDSIAQDALKSSRRPSEEGFQGDEELEKENIVTEQCYIHAKVLIADDKIAIIGSSNLNDRSQLGYHDSELSIVIEDQNTVDAKMDGEDFKASYFAAHLRRQLWREHLGLLPPQDLDASGDPNATLPGEGDYDFQEDERSRIVEDPLNDELWDTWNRQAHDNTNIFRELFHCIPDNAVKTFEDYDKFLPKEEIKAGHLFNPEMPLKEVKKKLDGIRGHLVRFPTEFLIDEEMAERGLDFNEITESIYT